MFPLYQKVVIWEWSADVCAPLHYTAQSMTARSTNTILRATLYQMNYFLARGDLDL